MDPVKRVFVIFMAVWFFALGSGTAMHAHEAQHAHEDTHQTHPDHERPPVHDSSNCIVHAHLSAPLIATPAVVFLVCAGLLVAFLSELAVLPINRRVVWRLRCRGPPPLLA